MYFILILFEIFSTTTISHKLIFVIYYYFFPPREKSLGGRGQPLKIKNLKKKKKKIKF